MCDEGVEITQYEDMEKELVRMTDSLFQEVKNCVEDCKSDVKNTVVPLSSAEARMILGKQNQVLKELNDQILIYQKRADDLRKKIEQLQEKRRLNGESPDPVILQESESTRKNLQWLYCLAPHPGEHHRHRGDEERKRPRDRRLQEPVRGAAGC